jgi:hypothetical protein
MQEDFGTDKVRANGSNGRAELALSQILGTANKYCYRAQSKTILTSANYFAVQTQPLLYRSRFADRARMQILTLARSRSL